MSFDRHEEILQAYLRLGSWRAVSRELKIPRGTLNDYQKALRHLIPSGEVEGLKETQRKLPKKGTVRRYILTCAQNNTKLHLPFWHNLRALAEHFEAELLVSRFTYNQTAYGASPPKPGTGQDAEDLWYDPAILPFVNDERVELAPGLVWCGESNISPTAVRPLSGFETYTGRKSAIFPHCKIAMESVASGKTEGTKLIYTTGTVTQRNYIQKRAGLRAEWYCRQLNASASDGTLYDLDLKVSDGKVTKGHRVLAVTLGDVHAAQVDPEVAELTWGKGGLLDVLAPTHTFLHDLVDFRARNHHDRGNPHLNYLKYLKGEDNVDRELCEAAQIVAKIQRKDSQVVVVQSNHDNALLRWLREADYRLDPTNAIVFLECQLAVYRSLLKADKAFHLLEWVLQARGCDKAVRFLRTDESFVIARDKSGGIECGMHGHEGPNGTRGSAGALSRMGRRANIGHSHSAQILDGLYVAGTSSKLDVGYNTGPSSWTHSHIVTYENGKRAVITLYAGSWRAKESA
jgi:hypothetical protein